MGSWPHFVEFLVTELAEGVDGRTSLKPSCVPATSVPSTGLQSSKPLLPKLPG